MKLLFDNFDILAESPEGIKKLREMILQFAVQGELVPQDPNDEPAGVLLERIRVEKERLVKEGKIKKQKPLEPIEDEDIPFELPEGWLWCKLGDITNYSSTEKKEAANIISETWVLELEDIEKSTSRVIKVLNFKERQSKSTKNIFNAGDVLYGKLRPYLDKVIVADKPGVCTTEMIPVNGYGYIYPFYLRWFFKSPYFIEYANSSTHGMRMPRLGTDKAVNAFFALPPLAEQKRIVSKVDSLMALYDELEKQQKEKALKKLTLNKASLHTLHNSTTKQNFNKNWNHITNNFDLLYSTPENVKELKQTILQLAVQGKLVPQDPNDEPASVLLEKIRVQKERLVKEGKIKKQKPLEPIKAEEIPFELPEGWEWCRLESIVSLLGDGIHGTPEYDSKGLYYFINGNNLSDGNIEIKINTKKVSLQEYKKHKRELNTNTVLVSINGTIGNIAFYNGENVMLGKSACYFNLFNDIYKQYIKILFKSSHFFHYAFSKATRTTINNVSLRTMRDFPVPLPPLSEQKRIVAKVDSLMALCDRLGENLVDKEEMSGKMLSAVVSGL